jgi:hypothetical protein
MLAKVAHLIEVRRSGDDEPVTLEPGQQPTTSDSDEEQT